MLEVAGDHDWYRISLTAGQQITISLSGTSGPGGVSDTYLNLRSSTGVLLAHNDDNGGTLNSKIVFTATTSGTYYIDAGAWDATSLADNSNQPNPGPNAIIGNYTLSVQPYTPPAVWTNDQIANQLVNGYWNSTGQSARHFAVSQGGTITVNYSTLTPAEQTLAIAALGEWSDIIGVTFTPVTTGGQIRFDDSEDPTANGPVASTIDHTSGSLITSANIQISQSWVNNYGTSLNSYSFMTYLHEIGHALGLGHAGNYNNTADYVQDALYANDAWSTTIMSYFDQSDNAYFSNQGFTREFVLTPMGADIVAMQQMYGLSTTTRTSNTTYGFNSNTGNSVYNVTYIQQSPQGAAFPGYTIIDSGGIDTLDYSGFSQTQLINLNSETFSNIGGRIGNVSIARGTVIENATGGTGADTIIGNSAANVITGGLGIDKLTGGAGNDTFQDTLAGLNGDTITDFSAGDTIVITNASLSGFTFNVSGTTLTINGSTVVQLAGAPSGTITASAAAGGGVLLAMGNPVHRVANDFNGDGVSDVLWRDQNGTVSEWLGSGNGTFSWNPAAQYSAATSSHVVAVGDFNGDGRDDILWRDSSGTLSESLAQINGSFVANAAGAQQASTTLSIAATGDFNGDGRDDILWRDLNGTTTEWLAQANGSFAANAGVSYQTPSSWTVAGIGDFNHDGRDDILWLDSGGTLAEWLGQGNGSFTWNSAATYSTPSSWHVAGTGDFNGDGRFDIVWRDDAGVVSEWLGQANGSFAWNAAALYSTPTNWQVASTGDFNGDGRYDVLWRDSGGTLFEWLGQANGSFAWNPNANYQIPSAWHLETNHSFM